jgi:hypothetical protein
MAKRSGNPNWSKPEPIGPVTTTITEFEKVADEFKLQPKQYIRSTRLREWPRRKKNSKYIPEPLPRILFSERLSTGIVVHFEEGVSVFFSGQFLYEHRAAESNRIFCEDEDPVD